MSKLINFRKQGPRTPHRNWMGGPSFGIGDPLLRLRLAASSCFFGEPMYYYRDDKDKHKQKDQGKYLGDVRRRRQLSGQEVEHLRTTLDATFPEEWRTMAPAELMESAIDAALAHDPRATLEFAVELRQAENIRTTPQVILVRAANHEKVKGTPLVRRFARKIISRADEPSVCMAYQLQRYGKPIPNSLKRALRDSYGRFKDYHLAKYRMDGRLVSSRDVANLVHPEGGLGSGVYLLRGGDLRVGTRQSHGGGETWESIISRDGSNQSAWMRAIPVMGHMALLRNLRNLIQQGIHPREFTDKLVEGAAKGRQLPFRYLTAFNELHSVGAPKGLLDALEECLSESLGNLPPFEGRVMSLCDNSGSAQHQHTSPVSSMTFADIGNLMGVITGIVADEGYLGVFGDKLEIQKVRWNQSVFSQTRAAALAGTRIGHGTEHGAWIFWDQAMKHKAHYDHVFMYSDMQAGHGGLYGRNGSMYPNHVWPTEDGFGGERYIDIPKLIADYRDRVNPDVQVYLVQIAGYQDVLIPEFYNRTYILGGWSQNVLRFAAEMSNLTERAQAVA